MSAAGATEDAARDAALDLLEKYRALLIARATEVALRTWRACGEVSATDVWKHLREDAKRDKMLAEAIKAADPRWMGAVFRAPGILVTAVGSLSIRAGRQFAAGRKLGKTHQQLLVFCKGDPKKATEACGPVDVAELPGPIGDDEHDDDGADLGEG